jgi:cytochrome c oxidase cbb3-type subunit III
MTALKRLRSIPLVWLAAGLALACGRESPPIVTGRPPSAVPGGLVRTSELVAGPAQPRGALPNPYEGQANALADGERYYGWFNCNGCHGGAGGGGIGPPLADSDWIYGGDPGQIFQTIVQGRPNGMPSFGGQIPDDQVWKIVAYVSSLSGEAGAGGATADRSGGGKEKR